MHINTHTAVARACCLKVLPNVDVSDPGSIDCMCASARYVMMCGTVIW